MIAIGDRVKSYREVAAFLMKHCKGMKSAVVQCSKSIEYYFEERVRQLKCLRKNAYFQRYCTLLLSRFKHFYLIDYDIPKIANLLDVMEFGEGDPMKRLLRHKKQSKLEPMAISEIVSGFNKKKFYPRIKMRQFVCFHYLKQFFKLDSAE